MVTVVKIVASSALLQKVIWSELLMSSMVEKLTARKSGEKMEYFISLGPKFRETYFNLIRFYKKYLSLTAVVNDEWDTGRGGSNSRSRSRSRSRRRTPPRRSRSRSASRSRSRSRSR